MSNIKDKIEELITTDLINSKFPKSKDDVYQYRDEHFLNGHYDYLFEKFIKEYQKQLKGR
jgi:hypothetical protein